MQGRSIRSIRVSRRWLGVCGLLAVTLVATSRIGLPGLVVGGFLAASWLRLPPEYPFALGQFAMVLLFPDLPAVTTGVEISHTALAIGEAGLVALLVAPPAADAQSPRSVTVILVASVVLGALAGVVGTYWLNSLWMTVAIGAGLVAVIALGLYEYEYRTLETPQSQAPQNE